MAENGILDYQGMNQAIYRGATSNIIVDTQSMSIEIGAGNSSHTSNLHIECDHDANVASIQLNSNVVTEFSRSKKLIKYPRVALTSASDNAYENGYKVTVSNQHSSYKAWEAFDHTGDVIGWYSTEGAAVAYNGTTRPGLYSGTTRLANETEEGEWIGLELPEAIKLQSVRMTSQSYSSTGNTVDEFIIYAKKQSGDVWTRLGLFTGVAAAQNSAAGVTVNVDAIDYYKFFNLVVTKRHDVATPNLYGISIRELEYYGVPEYDPEAHGTDVTVKSVANVPNTDWLEVYYDAKGLADDSTEVNDLKPVGTAVNGTVAGNTTVSDGAFTFDGSGDYISGTLTNTGDFDFTVSTWVFETNGTTNNTVWCIGNPSSANPSPAVALGINPSGSLDFFVFGGIEIRMSNFRDTFGINKWHHIVCTRIGTTIKYFINGIDQGRPIANSIALSIAADSIFNIGARSGSQSGNNPMHGKIANFRLFNRALTSDEIYQLYAYQKEDFGHGDLSMTLKAGRLGIGTSEPRGALDVRGDAYYGCPVFFTAYSDYSELETYTGSTTGTVIVFNNTTVNKGGAYDTSNGRCTFPISGYYEVFFRGGTANATDFHAKIYRNGIAPGSGGWPKGVMRLWDGSGNTYRAAAAIQFFYYFTAGEYIDVRLTNNSVFNRENYNAFSVKYLSN